MTHKVNKLFKEIGNIDESILNEVNIMKTTSNKTAFFSKKSRIWGASVAAAIAIIILIPNLGASVAYAAYKLPVIGNFFEIITFRTYDEVDGSREINGKLPQISGNSNSEELNSTIEDYTEKLITEFKSNNPASASLAFDYKVITDTDNWFTLNIYSTEASGSSINRSVYYNIDKTTGEIVTLSDLFKDNINYVSLISENIKEQMLQQMSKDSKLSYYDGDDAFKEIDKNQNFYINKNGTLVIVFDEYSVAPGYMGIVSFEISKTVLDY